MLTSGRISQNLAETKKARRLASRFRALEVSKPGSVFRRQSIYALKLQDSGRPLITSYSEVAAGRIAPFHSFLLTFRVRWST